MAASTNERIALSHAIGFFLWLHGGAYMDIHGHTWTRHIRVVQCCRPGGGILTLPVLAPWRIDSKDRQTQAIARWGFELDDQGSEGEGKGSKTLLGLVPGMGEQRTRA